MPTLRGVVWGGRKLALGLLLFCVGGLATVGVGCQSFMPAYEFKGFRVDPPAPIPDFELQATTGQPFHLNDLKGDITLIYFGYTFCPDVCPLTLAYVKQALAGLTQGREQVHVVFISVDPERDTPEKLGRYLAAFDPTFVGLTDDYAKIEQVMKPFGASAKREKVDSAAGYLVSHTARLFLIGPDQKLWFTYPHGFQSADLQSDLDYLLKSKLEGNVQVRRTLQ